MKKTYINPSVEIITLSACSMICGSLNPEGGRGTVSEEFVTSGTAGEARGGYWDDED